jgi:uncharacterized membrane protein
LNNPLPQPPVEVTETTRLEAFSDGVFAIAITLLVLEIRLPFTADAEKEGTLLSALLHLWPAYLAYVTSFLTIAIMWANHHTMFRMIRHADRSMLLINALLLMLITFLNFPTAVVAEYFQKPDASFAAMFYSGTQFVIGVFFNLMWWYVIKRPHLLEHGITREQAQKLLRQYAIELVAYPIAFGVAFFSPHLSLILCLMVAIFFALPIQRREFSLN